MKFTFRGKRYIWQPPIWMQGTALLLTMAAIAYGMAFTLG